MDGKLGFQDLGGGESEILSFFAQCGGQAVPKGSADHHNNYFLGRADRPGGGGGGGGGGGLGGGGGGVGVVSPARPGVLN